MSDAPIPPDIRQAAEAVVDRGYNEGLVDAVCAALMAERERCAKIAEMPSAFASKAADYRAESIAAVIRSPAKEGSPP